MQVLIRRTWKDYKIAEVDFSYLKNFHWSWTSGGISIPLPKPFIHAYVWCNNIKGELAHTGIHGECPHEIKVVIIKKDNHSDTYKKILHIAGPKPG